MNTSLKLADIPDTLQKMDGAYVKDILNINWQPHPYMVGPRHISCAADHFGGILGQEVLDKIPCANGRCHLKYNEHKCNTVALIALTRDMPQEPVRLWLVELGKALETKGLDGFLFLEGFKFLPKEDATGSV